MDAWKSFLERSFKHRLSDYVTAIAWSPLGNLLAAASGAGEVQLLALSKSGFKARPLHSATGLSIDSLVFSWEGQWLAAAGQSGEVRLWQVKGETAQLADVLEYESDWIDRLRWHPTCNWLAFNRGKSVQIWDADDGFMVATLSLSANVQDLDWSPDGSHFAVSAQKLVHIWNTQQWDSPRYQWELMSPGRLLSWSPEGAYLASVNQDNSVGVLTWAKVKKLQQSLSDSADPTDLPALMQGFPGKIRQLAWADVLGSARSPILAIATREVVAVWQMEAENSWKSWLLDIHNDVILDVAFQPKTGVLASLSKDGWVILWQAAADVLQILDGAEGGFSCLAWHPEGAYLAAGGQQGEVLVWRICQET